MDFVGEFEVRFEEAVPIVVFFPGGFRLPAKLAPPCNTFE